MKKDLFERLMYIVLLLTFITVGGLVVLQAQANQRLQDQQKILQEQVSGQKEVLAGVRELIENQGQTTEEINKSLSCILVFFTTPNRTQFYISNLVTCEITNINTGRTETLPLPQANQTPNQNSQGNVNAQGPTTTQPNTPSQPTQPQPEPEPPISIVTPLLPEPVCLLGILCLQ